MYIKIQTLYPLINNLLNNLQILLYKIDIIRFVIKLTLL